jgi:phosphoserine phosphatase RsbX
MGPITGESPLSIIEHGAAGLALGDEGDGLVSGDRYVIAPFSGGVLVAVIDGLGHGPEAASASNAAARILEADAAGSIVELVRRCHESLYRTRGVVMSLASFSAGESTMTWMGVGNVEGVLLRARPAPDRTREVINTRGGVIGYQLPPLRATTLPVSRGDMLIMATDGIRSGFTQGLSLAYQPQKLADAILVQYGKPSDDALVVVVRYQGTTG